MSSMSGTGTQARRGNSVRLPPELSNIGGAAAAIVTVVAAGSGICAVLPDPDVWQVAAAYLAPASLAFLAYWWVAQRV